MGLTSGTSKKSAKRHYIIGTMQVLRCERLTKRAPDAEDSAARFASGSFLRLIIFLAGRLRRPRPSAGNAIRWAVALQNLF